MPNQELTENDILELNDMFNIESNENNINEEINEPDINITTNTEIIGTVDETQNETEKDVRSRQPNRNYHDFHQYYGQNEKHNQHNYEPEESHVLMNIIQEYKIKAEDEKGNYYAQTYSLKNGIKKFKEKGKEAAIAEIEQLHNREVFLPILPEDITQIKKQKVMNSLIFLTEKKDGTVKARACANGSSQRKFIMKEEAASPTVTTSQTNSIWQFIFYLAFITFYFVFVI